MLTAMFSFLIIQVTIIMCGYVGKFYSSIVNFVVPLSLGVENTIDKLEATIVD